MFGVDLPSFVLGGAAGCVCMTVPVVYAWVVKEIGYLKADVAALKAAGAAAAVEAAKKV